MGITLPKYQLKVPSETTRFRDLGKELREMGISIESILETFDYNGADPNLVLSRVTALEAWRANAASSLAALEADHLDSGKTILNGWKIGTQTFTHVADNEVTVRRIGPTVTMEGSLSNVTWSGGLSDTGVILDPLFRPSKVKMFDMPHNSTIRRLVYIRPDGHVFFYASGTAGTWWSFDQVEYRVD